MYVVKFLIDEVLTSIGLGSEVKKTTHESMGSTEHQILQIGADWCILRNADFDTNGIANQNEL